MSAAYPITGREVMIYAAAAGPGGALALRLARGGARIVLADLDSAALSAVARRAPDRIEAVPVPDESYPTLSRMQESWNGEGLAAVYNFAPLTRPENISAQIDILRNLVRSTMRGLVAGKGAFVTLVRRPRDPLALSAVGMCAALSQAGAALAAEVARHGMRVHTLTLPHKDDDGAMQAALLLASAEGRAWRSGTFDLD